ncbi:MAG: hypothetical protein J6A77_04925 [Lachnospiraceae bacterium]|nr:hypothetical protein [Lachnospiraceae bacterium]
MEAAVKEQKQLKRREYLLEGNMWKVILSISLPMVCYNLCNYFYGIYDMMLVQSAGIGDAADIVVLDQIKNMISTIGGALATGGGIMVARRYGAKQLEEARKCANTLFTMAMVVALITLVFIPVGGPFLRLFHTDPSIIENSIGYYNVQILTLVVTTMNSAMISMEKAKGNTAQLLCLNLGVIVIKISLTTLFVYGPFENVTNTWLAVSTLLAQLFLFLSGLFLCFRKSNILRIRIRDFNFRKYEVGNIVRLAIPVFIGNFLFSFGKVYVNAAATAKYGKMCVGALGISNTMAGLFTNITNSMGDCGSTIVSQNYGNKNGGRIKQFFRISLFYVISLSVVGTILMFTMKEQIAVFFAPNDTLYQEMIVNIFAWECFDIAFLGISHSCNALFNGFGKTKATMLFSMLRLFALRVPVLLLLMHVVKMDYTACGVAMFVSNTVIGIVQLIAAMVYYAKMKEKHPELFGQVRQEQA